MKNRKQPNFKDIELDYKKLKSTVDKWLSMSSYSEVNLSKLFQTFNAVKTLGDPSS